MLDNDTNLPADVLARLLHYVSAHGIATSEPIESINGSLLEELDGHRILLKRFVPGGCCDVLPGEHLAAVGTALTRLHTLPAPPWLPHGTRRLPDVSEQLERFEDSSLAAWGAGHLDRVRPLFAFGGKNCIVHGDYFADNLVVRPDTTIAILDWETASIDTAAMDLGFAIAGLACTAGTLDPGRMSALLYGYRRARTVTDGEFAVLQDAVIYAGTGSAYFRYLRHHIRFPNPAKFDIYREMQRFVDAVPQSWPKG